MAAGSGGSVRFAAIASATAAAVARSTGLRPTTAAGACSQRPMHGAGSTRTPAARSASTSRSSASPPASLHDSVVQTRTVSAGGAASPSFTTSKWW